MSSYFWNYLELPPPTILSCPLSCSNGYTTVTSLGSCVIGIQKTLKDFKQLDLEAAALSRLIYRTKHKLRQEKSFKTLQMINRCLTNYLSIHLPSAISSIKDTLQGDSGPTRQMLEWVLTRLLGVAHLFHRVYSLCVQAAGHLLVRMKLAHMVEVTFFSVAVVSRIWTLAQFIVRKCCEWYGSLRQYLDKLQPHRQPWLPEGVDLPQDIEETLGQPSYLGSKSVKKPEELVKELDSTVSEADKSLINGNLSVMLHLDDVGVTVSRERKTTTEKSAKGISSREKENEQLLLSLLNVNREPDKINMLKQDHHIAPGKKQRIDNGVPSLKVQNNRKANKSKGNDSDASHKTSSTSYKHSIKNIQSSKDLVKFLEVESSCRESPSSKEAIHKPLMTNCDKLQWSMMEKFIKKQIKLLSKSEMSGDLVLQEKLLKRVRKHIKCSVNS